MKIAFFELEDWEITFFKERLGNVHELQFYDSALKEEFLEHIGDVEVLGIFVNSLISREVIDRLPQLKCIVTMSTGFDHIDLEKCKERNITVCNIPVYGEATVAEHAFALIFAISRKIIESHERVKDGNFSPEGLTGFDLYEKTLGVVGTGNIGRHVIRIAKGIGMNVIAYNRSRDESLAQEYGFSYVEFDELLSRSDIITLHLPYNEHTHHFMGEEAFSKLKKGAVLVNTARGGIVDTTALLQSLENGTVSAAGVDVLEEEPLLKEEKQLLTRRFNSEELQCIVEGHMLANHPKVVMTPHNAFNSTEALQRIVNTTAENIQGFVDGAPKNVVQAE